MAKKHRATHKNADGHILPLEATEAQIENLEALINDELGENTTDCVNAVINKGADGTYQISWIGASRQVSSIETLTEAEMTDILGQFQRGN